MTAAIFFPNAQPREIRSPPDITKRKPELRRECDEPCMIALHVCEMCGIATRGSRRIHLTQIRHVAIGARGHGPDKLGSWFQVRIGSWIRYRDDGPAEGSAKLCSGWIKKRRTKRGMLRPCKGTIHGTEIFDYLVNSNMLPMKLKRS